MIIQWELREVSVYKLLVSVVLVLSIFSTLSHIDNADLIPQQVNIPERFLSNDLPSYLTAVSVSGQKGEKDVGEGRDKRQRGAV